MNNLKAFASREAICQEDLRTFVDWVITWTSRGAEPYVVITYRKNRKPNTSRIAEFNTELANLEENLQRAIENEETSLTISSIKNEIKRIEGLIASEAESIRWQPAKVVVNEEDLPLFLRVIDESGKMEVYEALKATGLRLNEFLNPTENPSCQGIIIHEDGYDRQPWTREYTWKKEDE